jgi:two-component system phosphate regulon sensor histidine kinase PhoR
MSNPWRTELVWAFWALILAITIGRILDFGFTAILLLGASLVLARHVFHVHRLVVWLKGGSASSLPQGSGIWEEVYYLIYQLRRRNKRRKKKLVKMLERFRTATAALPDATVVLGPRDEIEWFNGQAGKLLGLRRNDIGQQIVNLVRLPKFTDYLRQSDFSVAVSMPSPIAENVHLEIRVVPYGGNLRLLVAQDVTQLKFMERVRSDFVANVSHELRTPLTVLKGYIETLGDVGEMVPERYAKVFKRMEEQTNRMQNLINGLLSLTRLESSASPPALHRRVDVPGMLKSICEEVGLLRDEQPRIDLQLETNADLLGIEQELRSAFSNLVINAVKYTPVSGLITIRWREADDAARLDVADTGPGIAREHIPRLTERFYRVEVGGQRQKAGAGLGLAIVKHVLSRHDAELKITSVLGKGSCFSCCFPAKRLIHQSFPALKKLG